MEAIAKLKHLKGSPRKARLVIDLIRGQNVSQALSILKFTDKRAALPISKCLNSAIANATYLAEQQNIAIDPDDLWVNLCFVDMGPTKNRRRMRPAPQGRAYREQRHYCHITIQVTSEDKPKTEKQLLAEASKKVKPLGKKLAAKAAGAEPKKAKAEKPVADAIVEEVVETTPVVETVEEAVVETAAETVETVETTEAEAPVETVEAENADAPAAESEDAEKKD
ncbi:MAG: 50S ribosomal protein L22 [Chloracidobacterium sp.]|nr:50S ribosomal protein L22 [Chloracidobacterium sp.]MBK7802438.1 50S ribosomal protein L22 [Chloracidobacterium sp.]MBK9437307.1 50S ribosomal protein L22 [Chloracidobacterium sp.]MBL0239980.1 50S ribosomal protein L22 [Chloracidobacterium sp.]MBP9934562.1 50S ribosomal protein L22 [Pyrinomonadaceae bacterium]